MATVEVRFSALPAHVRTARLIASAGARRCGIDSGALDEIRLAVGEACGRAVGLHQEHAPTDPVVMTLSDDNSRFTVVVTDSGPAEADADGGDRPIVDLVDADLAGDT